MPSTEEIEEIVRRYDEDVVEASDLELLRQLDVRPSSEELAGTT